jgi:hypothetical protein
MAEDVFTDKPVEEMTSDEMLKALVAAQAAHREELSSLRAEVAAKQSPAPTGLPATVKTPEQLYEERIADIRAHSHYCPGCGRLSTYMKECRGKDEAPHPAIEMVEVGELLSDDPTQHTAAPATTNLG